VNGDDKLDLAILRQETWSADLLVYVSDGEGFTEVWQDQPNPGCDHEICVVRLVEMGDLDGDGNLDLVAAEQGRGVINIWWGNGDGSFTSKLSWNATRNDAADIKIADLNKDGNLDLAFVTSYYAGWVVLGNGDRTFQELSSWSAGRSYLRSLAVGDFDLDTNLDLATANGFSYDQDGNNSVSIIRGDGTGDFGTHVANGIKETEYSVGWRPNSIDTGDFNGDGFLDLVTANLGHTFTILLYDPNWDGPLGSIGGQVVDVSGASFSVAPGILSEEIDVLIRVEDPPPTTGPFPPGYYGAGTEFVTIVLSPNPSPLPNPGATIVLPLTSQRTEGERITLWKIDPDTGAPINTHIRGTVDPEGWTATFEGIRNFSTFVGQLECDALIASVQEALDEVEIVGRNSTKTRASCEKKLADALAKLEEGKPEGALKKVNDFKTKVLDLASSGKIDPDDDDTLLLLEETNGAIVCLEALIGE
jgi:hypothetical protein